jgi:hypothetical protein
MKGIQNKIIIYQKAFIMHIYGLHHYKRKLPFFSEFITFSINFKMVSHWWHDNYPDDPLRLVERQCCTEAVNIERERVKLKISVAESCYRATTSEDTAGRRTLTVQ